jgi:hypothetical protein
MDKVSSWPSSTSLFVRPFGKRGLSGSKNSRKDSKSYKILLPVSALQAKHSCKHHLYLLTLILKTAMTSTEQYKLIQPILKPDLMFPLTTFSLIIIYHVAPVSISHYLNMP